MSISRRIVSTHQPKREASISSASRWAARGSADILTQTIMPASPLRQPHATGAHARGGDEGGGRDGRRLERRLDKLNRAAAAAVHAIAPRDADELAH